MQSVITGHRVFGDRYCTGRVLHGVCVACGAVTHPRNVEHKSPIRTVDELETLPNVTVLTSWLDARQESESDTSD